MRDAPTTILVVDDESAMREVLDTRLTSWGYRVLLAADGATALRLSRDAAPDLVLTDVRLPDANGVELVEALRGPRGNTPVVLMTAFGTIDAAVAAMKAGAVDFLTKPLDHAKLEAVLRKNAQDLDSRRAAAGLAGELRDGTEGPLVGQAAAMREVYEVLRRVAPTDASVLVTGESGTGKEVVARTLHALSTRSQGPLVAFNMGALPAGLVESELFGHARGSFTGAVASRPGAFELAQGGTLFLDELAEMPVELQPKLLRVLEERKLRPVGARDEVSVDVRVVAATNVDPARAVAEGRLRADLFYRLDVLRLHLPPLRERREDIPLLVRRFLQTLADRRGTPAPSVDPAVYAALDEHPWPGNVRELRNTVERAFILADGGRLRLEDLPEAMREATSDAGPLVLPPNVTAAEAERLLVLETLRKAGHNKAEAARRLGMDVKTIRNKLKAWGITGGAE